MGIQCVKAEESETQVRSAQDQVASELQRLKMNPGHEYQATRLVCVSLSSIASRYKRYCVQHGGKRSLSQLQSQERTHISVNKPERDPRSLHSYM